MAEPQPRPIPFYCGFQYADWRERNCERCRKFDGEATFAESACEIDRAIGESMAGDSTVAPEVAARMGYTDPLAYSWDCPEREEDSDSARAAEYRSAVEAAGQLSFLGRTA